MRALSREEARLIEVCSSGLAGGVDSILGADFDFRYDRDAEALRVNAEFPEGGRRLDLDKPLASLAAFVGASRVA